MFFVNFIGKTFVNHVNSVKKSPGDFCIQTLLTETNLYALYGHYS